MDKRSLKKINELNESIESMKTIKRHVESSLPGSLIINPICNANGYRLYISSQYGGSSTLSHESHLKIMRIISECLEVELKELKEDFSSF